MKEAESSIVQVAQQVTQLLRAAAPASAHPQAPAFAREAERLLGIEPVQPISAPARSAFERQRAAQAQVKPAGLMSKLREVFGGKKP
jgi:hypothetical protein